MKTEPELKFRKTSKLAVFCGDITAALNRRFELMERFAECAEEKWLICPDLGTQYDARMEQLGFKVVHINISKQSLMPWHGLKYYFAVKRLLKEIEPDEVFVFHVKPIVFVSLASRNLKSRVHCLFAGLGYIFSTERNRQRAIARHFIVRLLRRGLKNVTTLIFQNPDDYKTFRDAQVISDETNTVIVNGSGVSFDQFPFSSPRKDGPVVFLLVARMLKEKGIHEYYEAAKALKNQYGDQVTFQLMGPFDKNPSSLDRATIDHWSDSGIVEYLGTVENVQPFLAEMSVFVLPSYYMEGTPKTILESMATGRPIITTDFRGCRETVSDGDNGFLVPPKNVIELKNAMEKFITNRELIVQMGQESYELARLKYNVHDVNRTMLAEMGLTVE